MTDTTYAVYETQEGWMWVWTLPDGAAVAGTADSEQQAQAQAEQTIREFYAAAH
jgi:hypothetical protein